MSQTDKEAKNPYHTSGFRRLCFTSGALAERLHKRPTGATSQARLLEFGEDVKKKLCFLSEVVPDGTVK